MFKFQTFMEISTCWILHGGDVGINTFISASSINSPMSAFNKPKRILFCPNIALSQNQSPPPPQFPCGAINSHLYLIQTTVREVTLILGVQYSSSLDTSPNPQKTIKTRCYSRNTSLSLFPEHSRRSARTWLLMTSISDDILCK